MSEPSQSTVKVFNADTMQCIGTINKADFKQALKALKNEYTNVSLDIDGDITVWND